MHAFGDQHSNHRYDDKQDILSFNDSVKNAPLNLEYRDFEEDNPYLTTHSSDSDHGYNDSNNSYDSFSHYTDYVDDGNEEVHHDTEYGYHDMVDYDDEQDETDDINDRPVKTEITPDHNEERDKKKGNLILVTPLPPENYTSYKDESHSSEKLRSYKDSGVKSSQSVPGTNGVNSGEKSSRYVSGAYEVTTQWSENITPTKSKPSAISQHYAHFSKNYRKPTFFSYHRPMVRNNLQNKFQHIAEQQRSVQKLGSVYSSVSKNNGDVYYGYEILHVPNNVQQKSYNDHNTFGNPGSAGRVKIQV